MKISLESKQVFQGGIFFGVFFIENGSEFNYDYITCNVECKVYVPGSKITIMSSPFKILNFKNSTATVIFTVPDEAPPTLIEEKYQISYKIYLYVYHGIEKQKLEFPFVINSSYIYDKSLTYKLFIRDDMMRFDNSKETQFQTIVNKMRAYDTKCNMKDSISDIVKSKIERFKQFDITNQVFNNDQNGDVWFYCKNEVLNLENNEISINIKYEDEIYATLYYRKYVKELLYLKIFIHKNFRELSIFLIKRINEELDEMYFIDRFDFNNCLYKALEIPIHKNLSFSFKSNLFEVEYHLQIHINDVLCKLPIILIDKKSNIELL